MRPSPFFETPLGMRDALRRSARVAQVATLCAAAMCGAAHSAESMVIDGDDARAGVATPKTVAIAPAPYVGYTGALWNVDYGVLRGRCDRAAVSAALGDPKAALPGQPPVALLSGVDVADIDRACAAHAIELARNGRTVRWKGDGGAMSVTLLRDTVSGTLPCREIALRGLGRMHHATVCNADPGVWQIAAKK